MSRRGAPQVVLDADGILAQFNAPFRKVLEKYGAELRPFDGAAGEPAVWHWESYYGATSEQRSAAWEYVRNVPEWWGELPLHPDITSDTLYLLNDLARGADITVVTARPANARQATERWLDMAFGRRFPVICCPGGKGHVLTGLWPDIVVEDKAETVEAWGARRARGIPLLVTRAYNSGVDTHHSIRVESTGAAIAACLREIS